jgi:uncharacterized membrane protein YecN with MAPEG domain
MVHVTAFFAGILAFLFLGLSIYVILRRYNVKVTLGDGGDSDIMRRIRAHANFAEYVPFALILMALDEINGSSKGFLTLMGILLVAGRVSHAYSLLVREVENPAHFKFRSAGILATFIVILLLALAAIF